MPKPTPKKQTSSNPVYVGVYNQSAVQQSLLEATKEVINITRIGKRVEQLRKQKSEKFAKFDKAVDEIKEMVAQVKADLPLQLIKTTKPVAAPKTQKQVEQTPAPKAAPLDDLDRELAEIEGKLQTLQQKPSQ